MDEYITNLISIFATIRRNPTLRDANIIVCPEAMPANAADQIQMFITSRQVTAGIDMRNVIVVMEGNNARDKVGCHKTPESTSQMFQRTGTLVNLRRIRFWDECLSGTNCTFQIQQYQTTEQARLQFIQENLAQQMEAVKNEPSSFSKKYTDQNDLVVAFAMIGYWPDLLSDLNDYYRFNLRADFEKEHAMTAISQEHFKPIYRNSEDSTFVKHVEKKNKTNL